MPISNALVRLYGLTYSSFASVQTGAGGVFQFSGVRPGTYHLHVSSTGFIDESFNNIRCESQNPVQDCVGAHGITFSFGSPEQTDVIFELDQAAQLAGRATIRAGYSWSNDLRLHRLASDATILSTHSTYMNSDGSYTLREVAAGSFFWGASKPYFFSQIFPGVTCSLESYSGCSTTLAASIVTNEGSIISGVDFDLPGWRSHMVKVVDADSGVPLENVWIDQWDVNGNWLRATRTDALGLTIMQAYESTPLSYERYVTTFAAPEYQNQVYDGVVCPDGTSVYTGGCGLAGGEVVPLVLGGAYPPPIVFALHPTGSIFASGFE